MTRSVYDNDILRAMREQVRRFIEQEIAPHGEDWERDGMVPREVLRKMGELGLFGIRYAERFGGSELDTLATAVFAETLSHSTFA
ncbi:MAG: acyl-CoA dehydrogenase, partial [Gammaproteobacteria bacterium]